MMFGLPNNLPEEEKLAVNFFIAEFDRLMTNVNKSPLISFETQMAIPLFFATKIFRVVHKVFGEEAYENLFEIIDKFVKDHDKNCKECSSEKHVH